MILAMAKQCKAKKTVKWDVDWVCKAVIPGDIRWRDKVALFLRCKVAQPGCSIERWCRTCWRTWSCLVLHHLLTDNNTLYISSHSAVSALKLSTDLNRTTCKIKLLLRHGRGAEYCDQPVCLSVCVCVPVCPRAYLRNRWTDLHKFLCRSCAVARSSSGGVAIRYVFPVLWRHVCL